MSTNPIDTLDLRKLGQELKRARKQRGLRQEDVAKIISVARTTLIAIENGERKIRAEELVELARAYGKQVSDFLRPRPVIEPFQAVQFRGPNLQTDEHREQVQISVLLFEDLCRNYLELERITNIKSIRRYPAEYQRKGLNLELEAEGLAQAERNRLGLGDAPLPPVRDILEQDIGIKVFYLPLQPGNLSGIYYYSEELGGCIAVNSNHGEDRCRWTMCHDLCHFTVDRHEPTVLFEEGYQRQPASERFADLFAKYFLMPTSSITQRFNEIYSQQSAMTLRGLCILAHRFGVSVEAMTRRLVDLRLMKAGAWERLKDRGVKIREAQKELGLGPIPGRRDTFPVHYRHLAFEAYQSSRISEGQFANLLQLDQIEARKVAAAMRDEDDDISSSADDLGNTRENASNE
jgi:Zn-dependent peptidase ImmA (M78 family)/transcriptional regulator with XRE-family HTH domain